MTTVGIEGGSSLCELGPASDVGLFFECIAQLVNGSQVDDDWSVLTDRLYRRYLRKEELDAASDKMRKVQSVFSSLSLSDISWRELPRIEEGSRLNLSSSSLEGVFEKYFEHFYYCAESARVNFDAFKAYPGYAYEPVRVIVSDMPKYMMQKSKPLEDLDTLEGDPIWLE